jgi:hypothetical protein
MRGWSLSFAVAHGRIWPWRMAPTGRSAGEHSQTARFPYSIASPMRTPLPRPAPALSPRRAAEQDEQARFNAACAHRGPALLQTATGLRLVWRVTADWWYECGPDAATAPALPGRNDQNWAALLAQVGEPRHPFFGSGAGHRNGTRVPKRPGQGARPRR